MNQHISLSMAEEYLKQRKAASIREAIATFLCIISVIPLIMLAAASQLPDTDISQNAVLAVGLACLLVLVAIAVGIFIYTGFQNKPYEFLDRKDFEAEHAAIALVREEQKKYQNTYMKFNIIGCILCILSPILLVSSFFTTDTFWLATSICVMLLIIGIGVIFFIIGGTRWRSTQRILKEGNFKPKSKARKLIGKIAYVYWLLVTLAYVIWGFIGGWESNWIIWPIAGVAFGMIMSMCNLFVKN